MSLSTNGLRSIFGYVIADTKPTKLDGRSNGPLVACLLNTSRITPFNVASSSPVPSAQTPPTKREKAPLWVVEAGLSLTTLNKPRHIATVFSLAVAAVT